MSRDREVIAKAGISQRILEIRGVRVMLDRDLAELYAVTTSRLHEQVKRNIRRFPGDFMFRLTAPERDRVLTLREDLSKLRFSSVLPRVFTEHGTLMLANVLSSEVAVDASIEIVRTFVRMREAIATHEKLSKRIDALEAKYDGQFKGIFDAVRALTRPAVVGERRIGFRANDDAGRR